jgi:putative ubiquitin-RnfH superfamily antitoxin RatB of RatAB toxin-antitoxin module
MAAEPAIAVELVYALPDEQSVVELTLEPGVTAAEAIRRSGLLEQYPEIDLQSARIGIHGRVVQRDTVLADGDRVEIYRPLVTEPKQARRRSARTQR